MGRQGHVAYPHLADNPLPAMIRVLDRLTRLKLDAGSDDFAPSNLEVTSIDVGNAAGNVIPAAATARLNVRFNDHWSRTTLEARLREEVAAAGGAANVEFAVMPGSCEWFHTRGGPLVDLLSSAIAEVSGLTPELSTSGGTSDARFFKDICPVVEFGLVGETMHQVDERVAIADLDRLAAIYRAFLQHYFAAGQA
jgi:succinyl-diaminopimelate desuccinylase